ncbi:MAG: D-tyrosyl-tRNA(Tyr) deacylase [Lachnospiraceae bacterium]|nr:D-tyrosyl-tRNA(Tyr) deacylase [Lachnospiraceae bacterium]
MRFVIQVVSEGSVSIDGNTAGKIGRGYVVLIGIGKGDTTQTADKMIRKLMGLRIFPDENGKTNLSVNDVGGALLLISQFTLYADCRHGNRPGFTDAADPESAKSLYRYILDKCSETGISVAHGEFGADMKVSLVNEGPFTIILDSQDLA